MSRLSVSPKDKLPTAFSEAVGQRIRAAREERGFSQVGFAERIERRQAAVSQMENGQMQPDATTLVAMAEVLEKPITYFFPPPWGPRVDRGDLTHDELELLLEYRRLTEERHKKLALQLVTQVARFSPPG